MDGSDYFAEITSTDYFVFLSNKKWDKKSNNKAVQEIMTYLQDILAYQNPFERAWAASFDLPLFLLDRIKSCNRYKISEMLQLNEDIIRWCALLNSNIADDYINCFFYIQLEKIFG